MPAIRALIVGPHPDTKIEGIWVLPVWNDGKAWVGITRTQIEDYIKTLKGSVSSKQTALKTEMEKLQLNLEALPNEKGEVTAKGQVKVVVTVTSLTWDGLSIELSD